MEATKRTYTMTARADAAEATAGRILDAAIDAFLTPPVGAVSLDDVARRAGVAKQTVLRRFGSKAGLIAAAAERATQQVRDERDHVAPGDVEAGVAALIAHYERIGDQVLLLLAAERDSAQLAEIVEHGRQHHVAWCRRVFAPALATRSGADRDRRLAQLVAVTDVYVWKLLRRDRGLSRRQTARALHELLDPLTTEGP